MPTAKFKILHLEEVGSRLLGLLSNFLYGQNCNLNSIAKKVASLTAQKRTNSSLESGFSFKDSVVTGSGQVYLGRAWGDYSRVVFSYTFLDKTVLPQGWSDWGDQKRDL